MFIKKRLLFLLGMMCICTALKAQIEIAHLSSKDYSGFGFGAFINIAIPVSPSSFVTVEAGAYYSGNSDDYHAVLVPFLLGFRYMLNTSNTGYYGYNDNSGFYIEPIAGYTIGGTDIQKVDSNGDGIYDNDGNEVDEKASGITAGLAFGYILSGNFPLNIGMRYEHVFVSPDPSYNTISLRFSYPLAFGRRN